MCFTLFRLQYKHKTKKIPNHARRPPLTAVSRDVGDRQEQVVEENDQVQGEQGFAGPALGG